MVPYVADRSDSISIWRDQLFWKTDCGGEFSPDRSRVRSIPVAGGSVVTHYFPVACQADRVASAGVAVDDQFIYWLTGAGQVVRLSRAMPDASPEVLGETQTRRIGGYPNPYGIVVDAANVYWSEGASIYFIPKSGGSRSLYAAVPGSAVIQGLTLGADGSLLFRTGNSLHLIRTTTATRTADTIASGVTAFAVSPDRIVWASTTAGSPTASVTSVRLNDLGDRRLHHATVGSLDARRQVIIDAVAIDSANAYWHERKNITGGPLYRVPLTGGTPTAISDYLLMNLELATDGRYLFWSDYNIGIYRLAVGAPPAPPVGDVWVRGFEVTQSIQTADQRIPLVADKRTFVRVYVQARNDSRGAWSGVTARLSVEGSGLVHSPLNSYTITVPERGSDRRTLDDSFVFALDPTETGPGTRRLQVRLFPPAGRPEANVDNNAQSTSVTFGPPAPRLTTTIYGARYRYTDVDEATRMQEGLADSTWPERSLSDLEQHRAACENMHALASFSVIPFPGDPVGEFACDAVDVNGTRVCNGYEDCRPWGERLIDMRHPEGGAWLFILQPEETQAYQGAHFMTGRGNHVINMRHNPSDPGMTMAHEMGHGWTLEHPTDYGPGSGGWDPAYPRDDGSLGAEVGIRYFPGLAVLPGQRADGSIERFDIMSYSAPFWISPYSYCKALRAISGGRLVCPSGLDGGS